MKRKTEKDHSGPGFMTPPKYLKKVLLWRKSLFERIRVLYILIIEVRSAPHVVFDKTFKMLSVLSHYFLKSRMCGIKVKFLSNIIPKKREVSTTEFFL